METRYKRSMGCNYMILKEEESGREDSYQRHIFLDNRIPGLLPCRMQRVNGESLLYYEITGCQSVVHLFEKDRFSRQDLEDLFFSAVKLIETLDEYLLERNWLLLSPSYVYRNMETGRYLFVWFPGLNRKIEEEFRNLTEYILPKINHEDKGAVAVGYGVYKEAMEECMNTEAVRQKIFWEKEAAEERKKEFQEEEYEEEWTKEEERQRLLDDFYREEAEEHTQFFTIPAVVIVVLLLGGMYVFRRNRYILAVYAGLLLLGALGTGIWYTLKWKKRRKSNTEEERWEAKNSNREYIDSEYVREPEPLSGKKEEAEGRTTLLKGDIDTGAYLKGGDGWEEVRYPVDKEVIWIGKRKESVDIWLDISTVSRIHAKIIHRREGDYLVDLNSTNGTIVNGQYLNPEEEYLLENGNTIVFAQVKFVYISTN